MYVLFAQRFVCGAEEDEIVLENDQIVLFTEESVSL